jgi:hypothetical protein
MLIELSHVTLMSSAHTSLAPEAGAEVAHRREVQLPSILSASTSAELAPLTASLAIAVSGADAAAQASAPSVTAAPSAASAPHTVLSAPLGVAAFDAHLASSSVAGECCFIIVCLLIALSVSTFDEL